MSDNRTIELRAKLTERGVKLFHSGPNVTYFETPYGEAQATEYEPGVFGVMMKDLTPEQAIAATLGSGTLTAEQVSKATYAHSIHADCADADWQAIADELNAELGSGTCENLGKRYSGTWFICSKCGAESPNGTYSEKWMHQEHTDEECVRYDGEPFNYCPNCGRAVKRG